MQNEYKPLESLQMLSDNLWLYASVSVICQEVSRVKRQLRQDLVDGSFEMWNTKLFPQFRSATNVERSLNPHPHADQLSACSALDVDWRGLLADGWTA